MNNPKISVITVVFNSKDCIENTILSIIGQVYKPIEFIIIDGGSKDGTLDIIKKHEIQIDILISERDNGIYDAMNKGLMKATGDYVWFINSGDLIYDPTTLERIFNISDSLADVYYGETLIIDTKYNFVGNRRLKSPDRLTWKSFQMGMLVSHQSIIVKRRLTILYDLNYKCSADFDWVIKILKNADLIINTQMILSKFMEGGQTRKTMYRGLIERFKIMKVHYGLIITIYRHLAILGRLILYILKITK